MVKCEALSGHLLLFFGGFTDHGPCMVPEKVGIGSMQFDKLN